MSNNSKAAKPGTRAAAPKGESLFHGLTKSENARLGELRAKPAIRRSEAEQAEFVKLDRRRSEALAALPKGVVVNEPDIYGPDSEHSWFADVRATHDMNTPLDARTRAAARLERYGRPLDGEMVHRSSTDLGRHVKSVLREVNRHEADSIHDLQARGRAELRAMSTSGASAGAFVSPLWMVSDFAAFQTAPATFLGQGCTIKDLPDYGMTLHLPAFGSAPTAGTPAENTTPAETDPSGTDHQVTVSCFVAYVTAAQQLHDRGTAPVRGTGPGGSFDSAIYSQLRGTLETAVDSAALTAALSGAQTIPARTTYTNAGLLSDLEHMSALLQSTAGTVLPPTAAFTTPTLGRWLASQGVFTVPTDGPLDDWRLGRVASGLPVFADGNVPLSGSNAQIVVSAREAVYVYQGAPFFDWLPDGGGAGNLSGWFRARQYVAVVPRYPNGVAVVTGAGYPSAPTWA